MLYVNPMQGGSAALLAGQAPTPEREKAALQEFERLFLFQMLREMRKSVPESPLFGRNAQTDHVEEMLDDFLAGEMTRSGQLGLAKQMQGQLDARRQAEAQSANMPAPAGGLPLQQQAPAFNMDSVRMKQWMKLESDTRLSESAGLPINLNSADGFGVEN